MMQEKGKTRWLRAGLAAIALVATTNAARADNPAAVPVPGKPDIMLSNYDIGIHGYRLDEFFVSGTAAAYKLEGARAVADRQAPYKTRIVVARPTDPAKFNGTVVVEWMNVSGGFDVPVDWIQVHREMVRGGYAYVAVSAQKIAIEGGTSVLGAAGKPLKQSNPARYGDLSHPGDAFSYNIFSDAGRLVRDAAATKILGPLSPKRIIAIGESQSAAYLTTYVNAVDPVDKVYDAIFVHSRFGSASPLDGTAPTIDPKVPPPTPAFRPDLRVPLIVVETETDLLDARGGSLPGYYRARSPDNKLMRVWEIPGTAHADNYLFSDFGRSDTGSLSYEQLAAAWAPAKSPLYTFDKPMNASPAHHYVVQAALAGLDNWLRTGKAPPSAQPVRLAGNPALPVNDAEGNALGGVRTPWLDVPVARLSGLGNSGSLQAFMVGSTESFDAAKLDSLYPGGRSEYLKRFEASLDSAIRAGYILPSDRAEILGITAAMPYAGRK